MNNEYEQYKKQGYVNTKINPNLDDISKIDISTNPMGENREDKSVSVTNSEGTTKKTSSIMMGYNKEGIALPDGEYINLDEMIEAINNELSHDSENVVAFVQKTGKKVDISKLKENIVEQLKIKAEVLLSGPSEKITNQETSKVSIKGENSTEIHNKGTLMFGNENINMPDGEYVNKKEAEKAISEYEFLKPGEKPIEVVGIKSANNFLKKYKKPLIIAGGVTALSISLLPVLVPGVMHANSVLWHTDFVKAIPGFREFLHGCNTVLGNVIGATYERNQGLWTATNGTSINSEAAWASVSAALATHAINLGSIGVIANKFIQSIKEAKSKKRSEQLEKLNQMKNELTPEENEITNNNGLFR